MDGTEVIFDENWCVKDNVVENDAFWANSQTTESISLLKLIAAHHYKVKFLKNEEGYLVVQLPEFNLELNVLSYSGLSSRRGEAYVIGDILLFLTVKREDYTYSSVTKRGFKYINILERDRLKAILDEPKVNTELLVAKVNYGPINKAKPALIPGKSLESQSSVSNKTSIKQLADDLYINLEALDKSYKDLKNLDDLKKVKTAKHDYLNALIFTTAIQERPIRTRNSLITVHGEGFERILQKAELAATARSSAGTKSNRKHKDPNSIGNFVGSQRKLRLFDEICCKYRKKPIIIVPSGTVSIIARQNIKQMLEDHQFVDPQKSLRESEFIPLKDYRLPDGSVVSNLPMNAIEIVHNLSKRPVKFRVIENSYISRFTKTDWICVVCVILSVKGEKWQFNGYPFDSLIDLFMTMKFAEFQSLIHAIQRDTIRT